MIFKQIRNSCEPKVIGVNNGVYQVEIDEKHLKKNDNYDEIRRLMYQTDLGFFIENRQRVFDLQIDQLKGKLLKKAKLTDIIGFSPHFFGFEYIVSQKFV